MHIISRSILYIYMFESRSKCFTFAIHLHFFVFNPYRAALFCHVSQWHQRCAAFVSRHRLVWVSKRSLKWVRPDGWTISTVDGCEIPISSWDAAIPTKHCTWDYCGIDHLPTGAGFCDHPQYYPNRKTLYLLLFLTILFEWWVDYSENIT